MLIKTRNPNVSSEKSSISESANSGITDIKVLNNQGFSANDYIVIGKIGDDQTELRQISSVSVSDTLNLSAAISFSHSVGTEISTIAYNQLEISYKTTESGSYTVLTTTGIEVDDEFTTYDHTAGQTTFFYRTRFYNSQTGQYSSYSAERKGSGPSTKEVSKMVNMVLLQTEDPNAEFSTREQVLDYINYAYQEVINAITQATPSFFQKNIEYQTTDFQHEYVLPDDFREVQEIRDGNDVIVSPAKRNTTFEGTMGYELVGLNTIYFNTVPTPTATSTTPVQVLANNAYNTDGSWVASLDATNVTTDLDEFKTGIGSVNFDIDVSLDAGNVAAITNSTMTAQDLSDYEDSGKWRIWVYLPDVTYLTNVGFRWGSSASDYWSLTQTKDYKNVALKNGWNLIEFDWASSSVTETGTPSSSAIDYLQLRITYSALQGDDTDYRLNAMYIASSYAAEQVYQVKYIYQPPQLVNEMDEVMLPPGNQGLLIDYAVSKILYRKGERDTLAKSLMDGFNKAISKFIAQSAKRTRRMIHMRPQGVERHYGRNLYGGNVVSTDQDFIVVKR